MRAVRRALARLVLRLLRLTGGTAPPFAPARDRPRTHAIRDPERTALGRLFGPEAARRPGQSGLGLITSGPEAFRGRRALAMLAERTLDVQYYLWSDDASGRLLLAALVEAADRGVRVRVLLDDIHTGGRDPTLALLDAHPAVEVRLFNPTGLRSLRLAGLLLAFPRLNHRMHNKAFIADGAVAIVGGRNVGDHYFAADESSNFRDLDLFAAGPVVRELSETFDGFWNSRWSVPVKALVPGREDPDKRRELEARLARRAPLPFDVDLDPGSLAGLVGGVPGRLSWGEATVVADRPDKAATARPGLTTHLRRLLAGAAKGELLIESAYFIPGRRGARHLGGLVARGVKVRVLTNSLASNDTGLAHSGYARYRVPLLRDGVELFELKPDARFVRRDWTWLSGRSTAMLHTKAIVVDRRIAVVGSFNLDPRSRDLNTEIAVVAESPELAACTAAFIEEGMAPDNAYRLELDGAGRLAWTTTEGGREVRLATEPQAGFWRRLAVAILARLPLEGQL